jgi:16S rRNA (guanine1207-N2)-methyltransferase
MAEHYYSIKQGTQFKPTKINVPVVGTSIELYTAGGVFSPKQLDTGTRLLIENAELGEKDKVLDLGCGYGVVGIALKLKHPGIKLRMSDVNERALKLTRMNLSLNRVEAEALQSDGFANPELKGEQFDTILLNPPQSAGKDACFRLIDESCAHLNTDGTLQLVARHQKGGKQLSKKMAEAFGNVIGVAKGSGFRVYLSRKER